MTRLARALSYARPFSFREREGGREEMPSRTIT